MYLRAKGGYDHDGQQRSRGDYLVVFEADNGREWRCVRRKVSLHQFGHFMMGHADIADWRFSLSGSFGHDGFPLGQPHADVWERLHVIPSDVLARFKQPAEWDHEVLRVWALEHEDELKKLKSSSKRKHAWTGHNRPIERAVPCHDSSGNWLGDVRNGSLVLYRTNGELAFARVLCWQTYEGKDKLLVLKASRNLDTSYPFLADVSQIEVVLGMSEPAAHREWFFNATDFGPEVCAISRYGALNNSYLKDHLDYKGELVFPESTWRKKSETSYSCTRHHVYLLHVWYGELRDGSMGYTAVVSNKKGREWKDANCWLAIGDGEPSAKPDGAVYEEQEGPVQATLLNWCEKRVEELDEVSRQETRALMKKLQEEGG